MAKVTLVYTCKVCGEVTAMGRGMGSAGPKAPAYCAACGSPDLTSRKLHSALPEGWHLVPCTGEAHANPHVDNCSVCAPRWGLVAVPVEYPTLDAYREAQALRLAGDEVT